MPGGLTDRLAAFLPFVTAQACMLEFGIFDHLDSNGAPLGSFLEERLRLVVAIEKAGFAGYHLAEHHSTWLGMAPSPSVFLSAAIQRTSRIKLGPLVYVLPLYHPLRLYEEICMLDHLSGGRYMVGVGRGGALIEHQRYGINPTDASAMYHEAFAVLMAAFENDVINFAGKFYSYKDFVIQAKPLQRPHPPLWYGAPSPDAIAWAVPKSVNVVSLGPAERARGISDRYRNDWSALGRDAASLPHIGITRHIVVADSDSEAQRIAQAAYPRWREAMEYLWQRSNVPFLLKDIYPADFAALQAIGHGIAGSPATVRDYLARLEREAGINYVLCQMTFGDMKFADANHSIELFGEEVMPAFR
jgi:alkanesulfonate monooxygenase SsuD/methylene tetrahydromethanopterin reductase-like flavin-dependent oxidoreductase (luciferase family)